jgi:chromosome segregation ATPase
VFSNALVCHNKLENKKKPVYEVNLEEIYKKIESKIDEKTFGTKEVLKKVIEKQIKDDFDNAEKQINDYIARFQDMFDSLLKEREIKEEKHEEIRLRLNGHKEKLSEYLNKLNSLRSSLDTWQPPS